VTFKVRHKGRIVAECPTEENAQRVVLGLLALEVIGQLNYDPSGVFSVLQENGPLTSKIDQLKNWLDLGVGDFPGALISVET
jgi:hypothetical protein